MVALQVCRYFLSCLKSLNFPFSVALTRTLSKLTEYSLCIGTVPGTDANSEQNRQPELALLERSFKRIVFYALKFIGLS